LKETALSTDTDPSSITYYVAPLSAGENSGIQPCNFYFNDPRLGWQQVKPAILTSGSSSAVKIVQVDPNRLDGIQISPGSIDSTAVLFAAVARTIGESVGLQNLFQASPDRSVQVPVALGTRRGLILLFAVPGAAISLRATTDPQIANGGPG
jgi:hypothetical protein